MSRTAFALIALSLVTISALAGSEMNDQQLSRYLGVISCVDSSFFDGGYTPGEPDREHLMTALLTKVGLPKYDESLVDLNVPDTDSYVEGLDACNEHWDFLESAARKAGIEPEDGW